MLNRIWLHKTPFGKLLAIFLVSVFFVLLTLLTIVFAPIKNFEVSADIGGLVAKINNYRTANGLNKLKEDQKLVNSACWLAQDHTANNGSGHTDSLGRDMSERLTAFGISGLRGENVARWTDKTKPGTYAFDLWKDSPGHNALMLHEGFTRIGVGSAYGSGWQHFVANFANGNNTNLTTQCGVSVSPAPPTPRPDNNSGETSVSLNSTNTNDDSSGQTASEVDEKKKEKTATKSASSSNIETTGSASRLANTSGTTSGAPKNEFYLDQLINLTTLLLLSVPVFTIWWFFKNRHAKL